MGYYPIVMDLTGKPCLIVGGGLVAFRKAQALLDSGARVTVISPQIDSKLESLEGVSIIHRVYEPGDVNGYMLVFAATDDRVINTRVSKEAISLGIPVNVVDDPELCSFIVPAVVRRGDLMIAVTTSGSSPTLSKRLRSDLEHTYGYEYGELVDILRELRDVVKIRYETMAEREAAYARIIDSDIIEMLRAGKRNEAREMARKCI